MTAPPVTELVIRAVGVPAKQGSKDFKGLRRGRPVLVEADEKLPEWRRTLTVAARSAMHATGWLRLNVACVVTVHVWVPRPKTVTREYPTGMQDGDADKYLRACCDALTIAGVWVDDKLAVDQHIRQRYADGRPPGARIVVRPIEAGLL